MCVSLLCEFLMELRTDQDGTECDPMQNDISWNLD